MSISAMPGSMIRSIPSPGSGTIEIGPLNLSAYGMMIALGVLAAGWLARRRLVAKQWGTRDQMSSITTWSVIAGVVGSRIYHVITDWSRYKDDLGDIPKIWQGGLGIPGGLIAGTVVGIAVAKHHGISARRIATVAAPAIPLAQAIGRWGNYWNQELFGRATDLPWALEIDETKIPVGYQPGTTFHPTFLYESLGNLLICVLLVVIDRRFRPRAGWLFAMYLLGYSVLRFGTESLRIDRANEIAGLRVNTWMSMIVFAAAIAWLLWDSRREAPVDSAPVDASPVDAPPVDAPPVDAPGSSSATSASESREPSDPDAG